MTTSHDAGREAEWFVIRRHGAFFRPDAAGYTTHIAAAGFYTREQADQYADVEGVTIGKLLDWNAEVQAAIKGGDRLRAALTRPPAQAGAASGEIPGGVVDGQDRKFAFRDGQFVNRVSGEPIPTDEPIIIFRARDWHALDVLMFYQGLANDPHHLRAIQDRINEFQAFKDEHPDRMKEPGITRHIALSTPKASAETSGARVREEGRLVGLQEAEMIAQTYGVPGGYISGAARGVAEAIRRRIALSAAPSAPATEAGEWS